MNQVFGIASKISSPWSLAAFGVAAVMFIVLKKRGKVSTLGWVSIWFLVLVPIVSAAYVQVFRTKSKDTSIYRMRVTVLDLTHVPVEDAKVWSSLGGEPKKVSGGWEFDIPAVLRPSDGQVRIFAAVPAAFSSGETSVTLESDYNPTVIVRLGKNSSASVHGIVTDGSGRAVAGARVTIVGSAATVRSQADGQFTLPAVAAEGEEVLLRVEKDGYEPVQQLHPAGNEPVTIVLK